MVPPLLNTVCQAPQGRDSRRWVARSAAARKWQGGRCVQRPLGRVFSGFPVPCRIAGFTLLELMAAIAIVAILLAMAVPSFENLMLRNRLSAAVDSLTRGADLARSEAVKRAAEVRLIPAGGGWSEGWEVVADTDRDNSFADEQPLFVGEAVHDSLVVAPASGHSLANGYVAFDALGGMNPHTDRFAVTVKDGACDYHRMVQLSVSVAGETIREYTACT